MKLLFTILFSAAVSFAFAQNPMDNIALAIKTGNAKELAKYFDSNVEITIGSKEGTYSKDQGELVIKDFFAKNTCKSFELIHKGSSGSDSQYGIGKLITSSGSYRTYFYLKKKGGQHYIQELRFEKE